MRIVVTGLVATYPLGGVAWDYLAYADGFRRLGHDVFYLEDTGAWFYDPREETFTQHAEANLQFLADGMELIGVPRGRWAVRSPDGVYHGTEKSDVTAFCRAADLFLNISGACWLREEYRNPRCHAYLDSDPGYTQAKLRAVDHGSSDAERWSASLIRAHDRFFTFAENMNALDCRIPECGLRWIPTRQPLVLEWWPFTFTPAARTFTTVMSWKTDVMLPLIDGVQYGGKDVEFRRFVGLPSQTTVKLEVAMAGSAPREELAAQGWGIVDAREHSSTMGAYRRYLQASRGEWSVAKNAYVELRSGWFSTRSAAYLALGKPAVVQDTAWSRYYPSGEGLFPFTTSEECVIALNALEADYRSHCEAARAIAERVFRAEDVLDRLLRDADL